MLRFGKLMVTLAVLAPIAVGVNVAWIWQLAPAAKPLPQLFVCPKSCGSAPLIAMLPIFSFFFPMFVSVTLCGWLAIPIGWLPNPTMVGLTLAVVCRKS